MSSYGCRAYTLVGINRLQYWATKNCFIVHDTDPLIQKCRYSHSDSAGLFLLCLANHILIHVLFLYMCHQILVSSNDSRVRLYDLKDLSMVCKYKGAVNRSSQIEASFRYFV